ncbi:MAG TPA: dUTP diphosphatase [Candidatus Nanoarchaeia archaeon]|nr:dUTP diphosphatase [Candidatus Nanoarchaeia archaeon]
MVVANFKLLTPTAHLPIYSHETDAGIDFFSDEEVSLIAGERHSVSTGVAWMPYFNAMGHQFDSLFKIYMQIQARSGLAVNYGVDVMAGVIDGSYRGEIKIVLKNSGESDIVLPKGSKIAQGIIHVIPYVFIKMEKELDETIRGTGGFGSTGQG